MQRVLVTGGCGFIGSHLTEKLTEGGYQVIILDNLSSGKTANIKDLFSRNDIELFQGSVTDLPLLQKLCKDVKYVFHKAAIPSVPGSVENPLESNEVNVTGTLNVLVAARDNNVKKVIYASSCSVYGNTTATPIRENTLPDPRSPYAVSKLSGEHYCGVFSQAFGLPTVSLRYFNVYGPRQDTESRYAAVIPTFFSRVSKGMPPVIFGNGRQTRDFVFVSDVVEADVLFAESDVSGVFNIGRGEGVSVGRLAQLIVELMGASVKPVFDQPQLQDIEHSLADVSKAKALGYRPKYGIGQGLQETMEYLSS